jgi:hypothetical protein
MQKLLACLLVLALFSTSLLAAPPDQKHINSIKKKVAHCLETSCMAAILTYDDRELRGTIAEADADAFVVYNVGNRVTLSYADVRKFKSPMPEEFRELRGALGGAAIAVIILTIVIAIGGTRG